MKKRVLQILCIVCISVFMICAISAADSATPMGSCYFETSGSCTCYEVWFGTVLETRTFSPESIYYTGEKHGETHSGYLSISAPDMGDLVSEEKDGFYTYRTYEGSATYCGYLSCNGDTSEIKLD